jgi:hypothetical protein
MRSHREEDGPTANRRWQSESSRPGVGKQTLIECTCSAPALGSTDGPASTGEHLPAGEDSPITAAPAAHVHLAPVAPEPSAASAATEDGRVAATAAKPQLAQHGHAMQYYRLHQPAFLDAVRARLLAANLAPGSPQLSWTSGPARFVKQLGFALTGPEARDLPELLYPSDPWALIDAHRTMDADPTLATGAMGWLAAAGLALAAALERSVRGSLPGSQRATSPSKARRVRTCWWRPIRWIASSPRRWWPTAS